VEAARPDGLAADREAVARPLGRPVHLARLDRRDRRGLARLGLLARRGRRVDLAWIRSRKGC
jgi:hypothetical protein